MVQGRECECGHFMHMIDEDEQEMGSWVIYECSACGNTVKVFEEAFDNPWDNDDNDEDGDDDYSW